MRYRSFILFGLVLLAGCKSQERIYEVWEIDEPPAMAGDSLVIEAPALPPRVGEPPPGG